LVPGQNAEVSYLQQSFGNISYIIHSIQIPFLFQGVKPWLIVNMDEVPVIPPLKIQSPFGYFAYEYCRQHGISTDFDNTSDSEDDSEDANPFYNRSFLEYVLLHVLPYAALQDHTMLMHNEFSLSRDTNNPVEGWFKVSMSFLCSIYYSYTHKF